MAIPSSGALSLRSVKRERRYGNYNSTNSVSNASLENESLAFGLTEPHAMSELRGESGLSTGLSSAIASEFLISSNSWTAKSHTLSPLYKERTVRIVWRYINGTNGTYYQGDFQLDDFTLLGNTYSPEAGTENFETSTSIGTSSYSSVSFSSLATGGDINRWNRDASGTSSTGTGIASGNTGSWYFYAETSGSSTSGGYYWLRSPSIVVGNNLNLSYYIGHLGGNVGNYSVYVDVES